MMPRSAGLIRSFLRQHTLDRPSSGASFSVQGLSFTNVTLLQKRTGSAPSKAGHPAWRGNLDGGLVKISEYPSEETAQLVEAASAESTLVRHFPRVIARFNKYLVAEWVEGEQVSPRAVAGDDEALLEIASLQAAIHGVRSPARETSPSYRTILESRFEQFTGILPSQHFHESVRLILDAAEARLTIAMSHPDLTPANLIRDGQTGYLVVVDNELMASHRFPHADLLNTYYALCRYEDGNLADRYLIAWQKSGGNVDRLVAEAGAYDALWALRVVGSDLQRGALAEALATADAYVSRRLSSHPLIDRANQS
jgi:streptomycin 6-kinase